MNKIAIYPGSFDPITVGHEAIVLRSYELFNKIFVAIGCNSEKNCFFSIDERLKWIKKTFADLKNIEVVTYQGLTVDFCKSINAKFILRGIRTGADFEYEKNIAQINKKIAGIETVMFFSEPEYTHISSSIIREIYRYGGDISEFVPHQIIQMINRR